VISLGEVKQVIPDCLSGAGGEVSSRRGRGTGYRDIQNPDRCRGVPHHPHPFGIGFL